MGRGALVDLPLGAVVPGKELEPRYALARGSGLPLHSAQKGPQAPVGRAPSLLHRALRKVPAVAAPSTG
eukprot:15441434-Alexandrium_andersonii.AAC.1